MRTCVWSRLAQSCRSPSPSQKHSSVFVLVCIRLTLNDNAFACVRRRRRRRHGHEHLRCRLCHGVARARVLSDRSSSDKCVRACAGMQTMWLGHAYYMYGICMCIALVQYCVCILRGVRFGPRISHPSSQRVAVVVRTMRRRCGLWTLQWCLHRLYVNSSRIWVVWI